jgi:hypothetical protein
MVMGGGGLGADTIRYGECWMRGATIADKCDSPVYDDVGQKIRIRTICKGFHTFDGRKQW